MLVLRGGGKPNRFLELFYDYKYRKCYILLIKKKDIYRLRIL